MTGLSRPSIVEKPGRFEEFSLESRISDGRLGEDLAPTDTVLAHPGGHPPLLRAMKRPSRASRRVLPTTPEHIDRCLRTLAAFARFMSGSDVEWYLTGGVALDLVKKTSFRQHGDLDVVLPIDQLGKLTEFLAARGVSPYRRLASFIYHVDRRVTIYRRSVPCPGDFGNHRSLKLFFQPEDRMLPVVDLHFVRRQENCTEILCRKNIVALPFPLPGRNAVVVQGRRVQCCDLRLLLYLKSDDKPKNIDDARRIAAELSPAEVAEVLDLKRKESGDPSQPWPWTGGPQTRSNIT